MAAGQAWQKYPALLEINRAALSQIIDVHFPRARHLLALGARGFEYGEAVEADKLAPAYIRTKVAEIPQKTAG